MKEVILVTGGAGYIGCHVVKALLQTNATVIVLDNLSTGFADSIGAAKFIQADVQNTAFLSKLIQDHQITTVMHFAASTILSESIAAPLEYYQNNMVGTLNLLQACKQSSVKQFIFSSTAAVYGLPHTELIAEDHPTNPLNPYSSAKLMSEKILTDFANTHAIRYAILRYFNVAGADPHGQLGQRTTRATHLIKRAVETVCGLHANLSIFGNDYPTLDGTCVRDYIHVTDLANAHLLALDYLKTGGDSLVLNCGYGRGFSVLDVIKAVEHVSQTKIPITFSNRRQGDVAQVVADNTQIKKVLNWKPQFDDLAIIVKTALDFQRTLSK